MHRGQITFDALDRETGEVTRGRIPSTREAVTDWAACFPGREVQVAVEACTGWLFVCEALAEAGATPHLAEPVETSALRGRKRRAKTDREDARWLRSAAVRGEVAGGVDPTGARALDEQLAPLEQGLRRLARRQPGCRALQAHFGIGELTAPMTLAELGDVTRLSASRQAVRCAGLDIGVHRSDRRPRVGKLTRQGSPQLRWALFEAAQSACRTQSPDHADYLALKGRGLSHVRASMTIARKLARRSYHTLRELAPAALEPVS